MLPIQSYKNELENFLKRETFPVSVPAFIRKKNMAKDLQQPKQSPQVHL